MSNFTQEAIRTAYDELLSRIPYIHQHIAAGYPLAALDLLCEDTGHIMASISNLHLTHPRSILDRHAFWKKVNEAWIGCLDACLMVSAAHPEQVLREEHFLGLREMVVTWGDLLEKYGLVDYEMGFNEREILERISGAMQGLGYEQFDDAYICVNHADNDIEEDEDGEERTEQE